MMAVGPVGSKSSGTQSASRSRRSIRAWLGGIASANISEVATHAAAFGSARMPLTLEHASTRSAL
jgi:hypothetical protein